MVYRRAKKGFVNSKNFSITTQLIVLNVVLFFVELILLAVNSSFVDYFALKPTNVSQGLYLWTIITHMFSHVMFLHLFVNMFVLFSLGRLTERILGRKRFFWFYFFSGLFAGILTVLTTLLWGYSKLGRAIVGPPDVHMLGASGAIFAIAGLLMILLPRLRFSIIFLPFFSLPAYIMIPLALLVVWIPSSIASFLGGNVLIGNMAHFGGFIAGAVYGIYLKSRYKNKIKMLQRFFERNY